MDEGYKSDGKREEFHGYLVPGLALYVPHKEELEGLSSKPSQMEAFESLGR